MPSYRHHDYGNLYVKFEIEFPNSEWAQSAAPETMEVLKTILPPPSALEVLPSGHIEDMVLSNVDPMQQRRAEMGTSGARANGAMDEDDDDGVPHGVQCASQ
jgi:DnaJ homolog subfamily A member 2